VCSSDLKNIHYVHGTSPRGPWSAVSNTITNVGCEGPSAIRVGNEYRVYFDPFSDFGSTYRMVKVTSLDTTASPWPQGDTLKTGTSIFQYSHGSIIEIPKKYVMHLLYGVEIQASVPDDGIPLGKANCGCGAGAGLAFVPPVFFKAMAYRKRKKKKR
jgi:hypothetical protein